MSLEDLESKLKESLKIKLCKEYGVSDENWEQCKNINGGLIPSSVRQFMRYKNAVDDYFGSISFPKEQLDFLKKLINLREVDHSLRGIVLQIEDKHHTYGTEILEALPELGRQFMNQYNQILVLDFWVCKQFLDLNEFGSYIKNHNLSVTVLNTKKDLKDFGGVAYEFYHEGVACSFRKSMNPKPVKKVLVHCDRDGGFIPILDFPENIKLIPQVYKPLYF